MAFPIRNPDRTSHRLQNAPWKLPGGNRYVKVVGGKSDQNELKGYQSYPGPLGAVSSEVKANVTGPRGGFGRVFD